MFGVVPLLLWGHLMLMFNLLESLIPTSEINCMLNMSDGKNLALNSHMWLLVV